MCGIAVIGDLVAHTGGEPEGAAVLELGVEFTLQHIKNVPTITPMIGKISEARRGAGAIERF